MNDDLSISYGYHESEAVKSGSTANVTLEGESFQIAYTMGGASLRVATVDAENTFFGTATTADVSATIVSMGLAF